jgi:hypothetical protein
LPPSGSYINSGQDESGSVPSSDGGGIGPPLLAEKVQATMTEKFEGPLPAVLMAPWLADNETFQRELQARDSRLKDLAPIRARVANEIRTAENAKPCALGAVDAASILVGFGDQISILLQMIHVAADGSPTIGLPQRVTGIDGQELRMAITPMRVAAECEELAKAQNPTIADTSYWSFLMEMNQAITRREHNSSLPVLEDAVRRLVDDGAFLGMVENPNVVPMSKISQSDTLIPGISDRHAYGLILLPGEFVNARPLTDGTTGSFGIEKRRWKAWERNRLDGLYKNNLGVIFYKPHEWSRAYRIEGHLDWFNDDAWLMPLLAAIKEYTAVAREVIEPWPQFMADFIAKTISAVGELYGEINWHRSPNANYLHHRTGR